MRSGGVAVVPRIGARRAAGLVGLVSLSLFAGAAFWRRTSVDPAFVAPVRKGDLTARLTVTGILRPIQSITYRSPLPGREAEIIELVPEGTRVSDGDLLVRLDVTELQRDAERMRQEVRQAEADLQVADIERQEAEAAVTAIDRGEGALALDEARTRVQIIGKRVDRLRQEYEQLKPLLEEGFITRDELKKTGDDREQAEEELTLARKRADVAIGLNHPRDKQRTALQLAQKTSQLENARARVEESRARLKLQLEQIENCSIYAKRPGIVVYEEFLSANPRRKVRVGDRVTASQGLVTIPEVNRMVLEASVSEADVHRVSSGQAAAIHVEAFPDLRLAGTVARVGSLARASVDRPFEEKRFDVLVQLDPTPADLRPEMTARADIVVSSRTGVLLAPINAIFDRQGTFVAHVSGPHGIETRPVSVGESNGAMIEVTSGLREGEELLLTE